MFSFNSIVLIAGALAFVSSSAVPAVPVAAPIVEAPAHIGYTHAVPQNIPPYAAQISVVNRAINPVFGPAPLAAPYIAGPAPYVAGPAPYVAGPAPYVAGEAPYVANPATFIGAPAPYISSAPVVPASYAAAVPAPYAAAPYPFSPYAAAAPFSPYAAAAQYIRAPVGLAPAFVR